MLPHPTAAPDPAALPAGATASAARSPAAWPGRRELRADLRSAVWTVLVTAALGAPAGLLWWLLAPRAQFEITADGPVPVGMPSAELLVADDVVFVLVVAGLGLLCGTGAWFLRRRRGVAIVLALSLGTLLAAMVAWQLGQLLGEGPDATQLTDVGARVTTGLTLHSLPGLAAAPFTALLAYLVGVLVTGDDALGRVDEPPERPAPDTTARVLPPSEPSAEVPPTLS